MMIFAAHLNYLYFSVLFYLLSKIICNLVIFRRSMHYKRSSPLSSIPENSESEEKWIPKKKHEVLKAKYKCLKKLFQIYDANVIGMLPETLAAGDTTVLEVEDSDEGGRKRKRKRTHRVRLDACAGTSEHEIQTAVQVDSSKSTTFASETCIKSPSSSRKVYAGTQASRESLVAERDCSCTKANMMVYPTGPSCSCTRLRTYRQRKRTRFQVFVQRLLGLRSPNRHRCLDAVAVSECDMHHRMEPRRRRIRLRRARRPTRAQSEGAMHTPALVCAQTVHRTCLQDTTPRQCPIAGCRKMSYGIINYNDHLNLCHFLDRRYPCHFCHEGFERDADKLQHESEHVGLNHLPPVSSPSSVPPCRSGITMITQTDPEPSKEQDEKLKKIVSFFDKIVDSSQMLSDAKKARHSEMHLPTNKAPTDTQTVVSASDGHSKISTSSNITGKRVPYSCNDLGRKRNNCHSLGSDVTSQCCSENCNFCGENYDYSQALERKFGEFHSCRALPARRGTARHVPSAVSSSIGLDQCASSVCSSVVNSSGVLSLTDHFEETKASHKPSTSVVFSASDCSRKVSTRSVADRFKSYKWEPCTRIIRV